MMNIALPRKKSSRGSRPWLGATAYPGIAGRVIRSARAQPARDRQTRQVTVDELDGALPPDRHDDEAGQPYRAGLFEEHPAIAIGIDAERRDEVKEDRATHDREGERGADDLGRRKEQQDRGDQLHRALADPHEFP